MLITVGLSDFISNKLEQLDKVGIDYSNLEMDHFAYQTSSKEDYESKKEECKKIGELIKESIVEDRRVAIFENKCPIQVGNYLVSAFELVEPKEGQIIESKLVHIEFVIPSFDKFIEQYPNSNLDTSKVDRPEFPKISINSDDGTSIKFHTKNILLEA